MSGVVARPTAVLLVALTGVAMVMGTASTRAVVAQAPSYLQVPIAEPFLDKLQQNKFQLLKNAVLRDESGAELNAKKAEFDAYYSQYLFPKMTQLDSLVEIPSVRADLNKDFATIKSNAVRDYLLQKTLKDMDSIAKGNFHPGVRYNAMLMIGDLDAKAANLIYQEPPVPYPAALGTLVKAYNDANQIDAVRIAALLGIQRHAIFSSATWSEQIKSYIVNMAGQLLQSTPEQASRSEAGHAWMQRRAIEILAAIGDEGKNGEQVALIEQKLADAAAPMSLRLTAAENIGKFAFTAPKKPDFKQTSAKLASLAVSACQDELSRIAAEKKRAEELKEASSGTSGMYGSDPYGSEGYGSDPYGMEGYGAMGTMGTGPMKKDDDYKMNSVRRRIKYQLNAVRLGLKGRDQRPIGFGAAAQEPPPGGIAKLAKPAEKKVVDDLVKAIDDVMAVMNKAEIMDLDTLTTETKTPLASLRTLATNLGGVVAPAPADDPLSTDPTAAPATGPASPTPPATTPATPAAAAAVPAAPAAAAADALPALP